MTIEGWTLILLFTALTVALAQPVGAFLFALYEGRTTPLHRVLGPVERGFYRLAGIRPDHEQTWRAYALHMLLFLLCVFRLEALLAARRALAATLAGEPTLQGA